VRKVRSISLDLAQKGQVEIRIFDVAGHVVRRLVDRRLPAGRHAVVWNGLDDAGGRVASGVYFYALVAADYRATRKLVVLR
jgi:flagellar hook assembly protein FlgD